MKILEPLFINVIETLNRHEVEFLLIGGYAVNYYGFIRYTGDIDFWINSTAVNKKRFVDTLTDLQLKQEYIEQIEKYDFNEAQVISIGELPLRVDFLTQVNLVDFKDAWHKKKLFPLKSTMIPIVDYESLIKMKFTTGRSKDKIDLEELQKINHSKVEKSIFESIKKFIERQ